MKGRILFNGNAGGELIERVAPWVRGSAGGRPPGVLLVTAAWGEGERDDGGIRGLLAGEGLGDAVVNLDAWNAWSAFLARRPDVRSVWLEIEDVFGAIRSYYLEKTAFHASLIRRGVREVRARVPHFSLGGVHARDPVRPEAVLTGLELIEHALSRELVASIDALVDNDSRMLLALQDAEEQLLARTGLRFDPEWRALRAVLEQRLLWADAIVVFGGSPTQLLAPFRFFDLRPALLETVRRGATVVTSSAGSLVMCERMVVYDDYHGDPLVRDFRLLDRGLGLVGGLQILPHCDDRIQTDDPDNLAYLARRFSSRLCAGLNEESYLLVDLAGPTLTSVGARDGVHVFGPEGKKLRYDLGERIPLR